MRLDKALQTRGLVRSRTRAAALIAEGLVQVDGVVATRPSQQVGPDTVIEATVEPWVSRAAHKLLGALDDSGTVVRGRVLDAGASTGGFTQVALARGAQLVHAVDVGHDQLAPELRDDPRVRVHEGLNLRDLTLEDLDGERMDLVVGDVSFISLRLLLPSLLSVLRPDGEALLLVKPQFEVGRGRLGAGGVVHDPELRRRAVDDVIAVAASLGWDCVWQGTSRLPGAEGNVEFFIRLVRVPQPPDGGAPSRG
ncbi:TlyA family RNA methyltransferase [Arachnia propionica]|uniref:TlyA family RNA methyltransferase n=1 Tax=Arachnia propionica TaxID=1750 RepID=A0A3P1WTN2_9ACTN|nr:TlyA family RNA methyltransferase [Arachnia propionica]RRD49278.1 TlyA family RNA methyltransferase [Arachnia propionica]